MRKYSISDMNIKAREFGGQCLSTTYRSIDEKFTWKCKRNHIFRARATNVIYRNQWCPKCGLIKRAKSQSNTIDDCHKLAKSKGGKCLSKVYKNVGQKIKWQCFEGHKWSAPYRSVNGSVNRTGTWCPKCNGPNKRNITYAREIAKSLGWKCLSSSYSNYISKLEWKCANGHTFEQSLAKVVGRKSCPKFKYFFGEELCRFYFESIFNVSFVKARPDFLKREDGIYDELDGYNEKLKLAFEHQGRQHYEYVAKFHKGRSSLLKQQKYDSRKRALCKKQGVTLIEIPSIPEFTSVEGLKALIIKELKRNKIKL